MTSAAANTSRSVRPRLTPTQVLGRLSQLSRDHDVQPDAVVREVVDVTSGLTGALGVLFLARQGDAGQLALLPTHYSPPHLEQLRALLDDVHRLAVVACAEETPQASITSSDDGVLVVVVPVLHGNNNHEAIAIAMGVEPSQQRSVTASVIQLLTWVASYLALLRQDARGREARETNENLRRLSRALSKATEQKTLADGVRIITDWVQAETRNTAAVIGLKRGRRGPCQLVGYSNTIELDRRAKRFRIIQELLDETLIAATNGQIDVDLLQTSAVGALRHDTGFAIAERYLLQDAHGRDIGVILCLNREQAASEDSARRPLSAENVRLIGQQIGLLIEREPNVVSRVLGRLRHSKPWYRSTHVWYAVAVLLGILLLPVPFRVKCDCVVQTKLRRFVSAPYEGRLEQALIQPGEVVRKGDLLARMDGTEIEFDIAGLRAELQSALKDRDTALAARDTAAAQIAGFRAERVRLKISALQERLENLEVRSPVDGVVIGGDPRRLEGARLSLGETLMEVGPVEEMIVELEIPDEAISHIENHQSVRYRLAALPQRVFDGEIELVHARSQSRANNNVFIAEVALTDQTELIRPGMRGRAKIKTTRHPLGWNLFHKAWHRFLTWVLW